MNTLALQAYFQALDNRLACQRNLERHKPRRKKTKK